MNSVHNSSVSKPISEAPESSAGDDFHLLWAGRKALELLIPNGNLKALSIEGPSPEDSIVIDPEGDQLLGIDLTEYLGGEKFVTAHRVIYSQLKYSTRHATEPWTTARLCRGKKHGTSGSIIHRLAQIFATHLTAFDRDAVLQRLCLKLVSNRPISATFAKAIAEAKQVLQGSSQHIQRAELLCKLSPEARAEIEKLDKAAKLQSCQFTDFIRILDFSDCGTGSRFDQSAALIRTLGGHGTLEVTRQYSGLTLLIHRRMMPEARDLPPLGADDIVPIFGLPSLRSAFPAETRFEPLDNPIERLQRQDISKAIIEHNNGPICLHASAGCGKTTVARLLDRYLPESSVAVLFDCYGAGSYLDPAEVRHSHRRAIMQIANELAVRTGSPLLLSVDLQPEDLLRALVQRLEIAAEFLHTKSAEALVVVIIDAADNSIAAAEQFNERSFVTDLVRCEMPDGCRLIVTSRSHRQDTLGLPMTTTNVELRPFNGEHSVILTPHRDALYNREKYLDTPI